MVQVQIRELTQLIEYRVDNVIRQRNQHEEFSVAEKHLSILNLLFFATVFQEQETSSALSPGVPETGKVDRIEDLRFFLDHFFDGECNFPV